MTNKAKKVAAPRLRFPGFEGEWEEKKLGEVGQTLGGLTGKAGADFGSGKPFVTYKQVFDYSDVDFSKCGLVKIKDGERQTELNLGDILITMSSETPEEVGFASVVTQQPGEKVYLNSFCFLLRPKSTEILDVNFSKYLFHSPIYRKAVVVLAQGVTRFNISKNRFLDLSLPLPPTLPEQNHIAAALSSIDAVIAAHQSKLNALREHKRGLMAQLFPAEGETVPRFRFPEFEDSGEWEEKKLGEVATFLNGRAYAQDELLAKGKYKVLRVGNFFSSNSWYYSDLELDETKYCEPGDLLYAWSASFGPRIWKEPKAIFHYHIWKVVPKKYNDLAFLFHMLDKITDEMKANLKNGLGIFHITKSGIENWGVSLPPTLPEQTRIAAFLSNLDDLITAQADKIAALQEFKRGLMQGLFPSTTAPQEAAE